MYSTGIVSNVRMLTGKCIITSLCFHNESTLTIKKKKRFIKVLFQSTLQSFLFNFSSQVFYILL